MGVIRGLIVLPEKCQSTYTSSKTRHSLLIVLDIFLHVNTRSEDLKELGRKERMTVTAGDILEAECIKELVYLGVVRPDTP